MSSEFRKASDLISSLFKTLDVKNLAQANSFLKTWNDIVGEKIAAHSTVIDVDQGIVIVEVDHPGWSQQIQFKKKQILYSLIQNFPELKIKNIAIRIVSECKSPYKKQNVPVGAGVVRSEELVPDTGLPDDMDQNLKEILEKLKQSIKKGKPTD